MSAANPQDRFRDIATVITALQNYDYKETTDDGLDIGELVEGIAKLALIGVGVWAGAKLLGGLFKG